MSRVFFIGDLHFGHKNILSLRHEFKFPAEHDQYIEDSWNSKVTKKDLVFVLGDVAFTKEGLERVGELNGRKILVKGNHDEEDIHRYLIYFNDVVGLGKYKDETGRYWLSHCPIHSQELRGRNNIHGHTHHSYVYKDNEDGDAVRDFRYYNTSCEAIGYEPKTTKELLKQYQQYEDSFKQEEPSPPIQVSKAVGGSVQQINGLYKWVPTSLAQAHAADVSNSSEPGDIPS